MVIIDVFCVIVFYDSVFAAAFVASDFRMFQFVFSGKIKENNNYVKTNKNKNNSKQEHTHLPPDYKYRHRCLETQW
jgi:hypothetical protein